MFCCSALCTLLIKVQMQYSILWHSSVGARYAIWLTGRETTLPLTDP